jgi:hypothetical protein
MCPSASLMKDQILHKLELTSQANNSGVVKNAMHASPISHLCLITFKNMYHLLH